MNQIDYYSVLGLTSSAGTDEIRAAYRRLAFQFHPDRNANDPAAAEQMKKLNEAYAVLSDDTKKKNYDSMKERFGDTAYTHFRSSYSEHDIFSGSDINKIFEELARDFGFRSFDELFREFYGSGYKAFNFKKNGFSLKGFVFKGAGSGNRINSSRKPSDGPSDNPALSFPGPGALLRKAIKKIAMFSAPSSGKDVHDTITLTEDHALNGGPYAYLLKNGEARLLVKIPKGVRHGQKIRLAGMGRAGKNGGEPGNLYLKVFIKTTIFKTFIRHIKQVSSRIKSSPFGKK